MTIRTCLLALALAAAGCAPRLLPGTDIADDKDNRAVYDVVMAFRAAMEKKDVKAVLALVAPDYYDTAGTPDPSDDLDRARLEATLPEDLSRAEAVKLEITFRKIEIEGDDARVEVFFDAYYRVKTPATAVPRRDSDVHRIRLHRSQGAWLIVSGL